MEATRKVEEEAKKAEEEGVGIYHRVSNYNGLAMVGIGFALGVLFITALAEIIVK